MDTDLTLVGDDLVAHHGTYSITLYQSPDPIWGNRTEAARARALKRYADALKPRCSRCDKVGAECRKREACNARRLKRALKGCDGVRLHGVALPHPPEAWIVARRYGRMSSEYRSGGRVRTGNAWNTKLHMNHNVDRAAMRQHYAYDLAMGLSWDDEAELAA